MINLNQYHKGSSPYENAYALRYPGGEYSLEPGSLIIPESGNDRQHTLLEGETLQNIAYKYYKDSGKWYIIAEANQISNPFKELEQGTILIIPNYG